MLRIDAHHHFWRYDPVEYNWMTDEMSGIKKDFLPIHLKPLLEVNNIDGSVLVQVTQTHGETDFLLKTANENDFIQGVVGWVDLRAEDISTRLKDYHRFPKLKGFRHILQSEEPDFMLQPAFLRGIAALREFDFCYDILIYPGHLSAALKLVEKFPDQLFVIDHIGKPNIRENRLMEWQRGIAALASHDHVYCKISGMVTEADWETWPQGDFRPYLDVVVNSFGFKRIMYGSDWPMCLVAASYEEVYGIVNDYFASFSVNERQLFFGGNAIRFYKL